MIFLNGNLIEPTLFPDNTSQVWKIAPRWRQANRNIVKWEFSNEGEFLQLAQLKTLLDRWDQKADLIIPYLPYGRQDKVVSNFNTFALHTFCKLLNTLNFQSVLLKDPHSDVPLHLINNCFAEYYLIETIDAADKIKSDVVCYPDLGAKKKYSAVLDHPYIFGDKERHPVTGVIIKYSIYGDVEGKRVLIVDDICDGGATFVELATALYAGGAACVSLFVSHGLFTKGLRPLRNAGIERIFTPAGEVLTDIVRTQT